MNMVASNAWRSWLEDTKKRGMALGLANTQQALFELKLPSPSFETVHVAGSNGKGTTVATLSAALSACNVDHLAFTSPHLVRVEERIRINGRPVSSARFDEGLRRVHEMVERTGIHLTFFETTFLVAMVIADLEPVQVVLLETGLGGRLDATRVAGADIAVVTALSLEHTEILGETLEAIAGEKAAIARPSRPLIVRDVSDSKARRRIEEVAHNAGFQAIDEAVGPARLQWVEIGAEATYFEEARALAGAAWSHLSCAEKSQFPPIRALRWPGRMQEVPSPSRNGLTYLLEGAHNPSGMESSCAQLRQQTRWGGPWCLLLGSTPQSNMEAMLRPLVDFCTLHPPVSVVVTEPQFGRYPGVPCDEIENALLSAGLETTAKFSMPEDAVEWLETQDDGAKTVLSIGSLYLQGNVLTALGADTDEDLAIVAKE